MAFNEDTSFIEYNVGQPTQDFVINFNTIGGTTDVVLVTVDDVLTDTPESPYTVQQINHNTWRVTPEVPAGSVVRLYRVTDIDEMMHVFTAGAKFIARNMDNNFKQIRHAQQEVRDYSDDTRSTVTNTLGDYESRIEGVEEITAAYNTRLNNEVSALKQADILERTERKQADTLETQARVQGDLDNRRYAEDLLAMGNIWDGISARSVWDNETGLNQQEINNARVVVVDSIADLLALPEGQRKEGLRYIVKGYHAGSDVGGGEFYYDPERSGDNDGGIVLNGFIRVIVGPISPAHFGATVSETPQNQAIQAALSSYHHVQIDEPYWVDATNRLSMSSNQIVDFVGDGKLMALPNSAGSYSVLSLRNIENSTLNHPVIQGDKYTHTGTTGEWGNCLDIRSVKNVTVNSPVLTDAWGDCLYIGRDNLPSENLVINNPVCLRGRRQGISLIAGVGVTINNPVCEDIRSDDSSTPLAGGPHAGIDIEPNTYLDRLEDIKIIDPTTRRCEGRGLLVAITAITKDQPENHISNVGISVVRHNDDGSNGGVAVAYAGFGRLKGSVVIDSPTYRNSVRSALNLRMADKSVKVTVVRPVIIDHNRIGGTSPNYDPAVFVGLVDSTYDGDMGGMHIINPKIVVNTPTTTPMHGITIRNVNSPNRVIGVDIEDVEYRGDDSLTNYVTNATRGLFTSKDNSLYYKILGSNSLPNTLGLYVESNSETVAPTLTLTDRPYGHPDQHVRRTSLTQSLYLNKPAEGTLRDMDGTPLTGMRAASQYAYVQLRPLGNGAWMVVSRYGTWEIWEEKPTIVSVTYDPPNLTNGTQQTTTVTLTGARLGDNVNVSFNKPLNGTRMWGEVTSADTVTVYHRNDTGAAVDVASGTLKVKLV